MRGLPPTSMRSTLEDPELLGRVLAGPTWKPWRILLIAMAGEGLTDAERVIFTRLTGRAREPLQFVEEFWGIAGRRAGKSRAMACLIVFLAIFPLLSARARDGRAGGRAVSWSDARAGAGCLGLRGRHPRGDAASGAW